MTEQPSNRSYPQIFDSLFLKGKSGDKAYASDAAFFQKAFRRTLRFFRFFLSSPLMCKKIFNLYQTGLLTVT